MVCSKEIVTAITVLCKDTKAMVRSPDGDTNLFNIVVVVLQGDALEPFLCINCLNYFLRTSIDIIKENRDTLKKGKSKRCLAETITCADCVDDLVLL